MRHLIFDIDQKIKRTKSFRNPFEKFRIARDLHDLDRNAYPSLQFQIKEKRLENGETRRRVWRRRNGTEEAAERCGREGEERAARRRERGSAGSEGSRGSGVTGRTA